MSGAGQVLLGIPDIELLGILKIMCEVVGGKQGDMKIKSHTIQLTIPSIHRRVAYVIQELLKEELN